MRGKNSKKRVAERIGEELRRQREAIISGSREIGTENREWRMKKGERRVFEGRWKGIQRVEFGMEIKGRRVGVQVHVYNRWL